MRMLKSRGDHSHGHGITNSTQAFRQCMSCHRLSQFVSHLKFYVVYILRQVINTLFFQSVQLHMMADTFRNSVISYLNIHHFLLLVNIMMALSASQLELLHLKMLRQTVHGNWGRRQQNVSQARLMQLQN